MKVKSLQLISAVCAAGVSLAACSNAVPLNASSNSHSMFGAAQIDTTVPNHVKTFALFGQPGIVSPSQAAPYLNWAAVLPSEANAFASAGIHTVLYTDPNRTQVGQPMYTSDESTFAHDCAGKRITISGKTATIYLMDPAAPHLAQLWRSTVAMILGYGGHYDAILEDTADTVPNGTTRPCGFDQTAWTAATNDMDRSLGQNILFNGLGDLTNGWTNISPSYGIVPSTFGGMMEGCYSNHNDLNPVPKKFVWQTYENTEMKMSAAHRPFVCRGLGTSPAQSSISQRLYVYASFLLTYDPATSIMSEKFSTPSNLEVDPESSFVALDPIRPLPSDITGLSTAPMTFGRQYARCYLNARFLGRCATVINADTANASHPFPWPGSYGHTLVLQGAGVLDGGVASASGPPPSATLPGTSAVIAIQ